MPAPSTSYYPVADALRTGDLLFPKLIRSNVATEASPARWTTLGLRSKVREVVDESDRSPKMEAYVDPELVAAARTGVPYDVSGLLQPPQSSSRLPTTLATDMSRLCAKLNSLLAEAGESSPGKQAQVLKLQSLGREMLHQADAAADRLEDARRTSLMFFILTKAFPTLLNHWLGMTVRQFLRHPLSKLLLGAIERESGEGLFVGHVAMVLRETDGAHDPAGKAWVIEANTTDFSHYSVAVHPYLVDGEPLGPTSLQGLRLRGWANRRLAMGESLWHSRHIGLAGVDAEALRGQLVHEAKKYLGRRFGFFDDPAFGDDGRFYCAEFVHRVFTDLGGDAMKLDQHRWWSWLVENAHLLGSAQFAAGVVADVHAQGLYDRMQKERFFLLTLPMLYTCNRLEKLPIAGAPAYLEA
jgi:hypothetical protein